MTRDRKEEHGVWIRKTNCRETTVDVVLQGQEREGEPVMENALCDNGNN